jgi:micrococcal nuclease
MACCCSAGRTLFGTYCSSPSIRARLVSPADVIRPPIVSEKGSAMLRRSGVVSALLALVFVCGVAAGAQEISRIIDGDTIAVEGIGTVRLIGVDAPETVHPTRPAKPFAHVAKAFVRNLAEGQTARLEYDWQRTDRYNRTLAYVYLPDGTFLNAEIIRQGYGHAYTKYPFKYLDEFRALERAARESERGLWAPAAVSRAALSEGGQAERAESTVYVTRTGKKYHRAGCRHLARSQIPTSLPDAAARYGPCSVCKPPLPGTTAAIAPAVGDSKTTSTRKPDATSGRCQATTKKAAQCKRRAQAGGSFCWQHARG